MIQTGCYNTTKDIFHWFSEHQITAKFEIIANLTDAPKLECNFICTNFTNKLNESVIQLFN